VKEVPPIVEAVRIAGMGLWMPGYADLQAWAGRDADPAAAWGAPDPEEPAPTGAALGRINRRRAGVLGRALSDATAEAMAAAGVDPSTVPSVVGSSIGEAATMIGLLDQMWRAGEPMSPAAFTVSVHNAASGMISIGNGNQGFASSLAADHDTPAGTLLEGIGLVLTEGVPVLVACGDEAAPASLVRHAPAWGMLAAAMVLVPDDHDGRTLGSLRVHGPEVTGPSPVEVPPVPAAQALNPQVGFVDLMAAVCRRRSGAVRLDRGAGRGFWAELVCGP